MIRHVVMFKLKQEATAAQADDFLTDLRSLPGIVPQIQSFSAGRDVGVNVGNFDFVVTVDFENVEGYLAYRDNPEHQRMIREKGALIIAERAAVQFER